MESVQKVLLSTRLTLFHQLPRELSPNSQPSKLEIQADRVDIIALIIIIIFFCKNMMDFLTNISDYLPLTPLATHIGITCLFAQVTLTLLFNKRTRILPDGPWNNLTMYTVHSVVAFPFMVTLTYIGCRDWFFDDLDQYLIGLR